MALLTFNFRIDKELKKRLEVFYNRLKDRYSNISDLTRDMLDSSLNQQLREFDEIEPDLRMIGQKIEQKTLLSHRDIQFLFNETHNAYSMHYCRNDFLNRDYLTEVVCVFEAVLPLIGQEFASKYDLERYLITLSSSRSVINIPSHKLTIWERINETKRYITESEETPNGEEISRILSTSVSGDHYFHISISELNSAIEPYKITLLKLAKMAYFLRNNQPIFHFISDKFFDKNILGEERDSFSEGMLKPYQQGVFRLRVAVRADFSAILNVDEENGKERHMFCFNFQKFNEFLKLIKIVNETNEKYYQFQGKYCGALSTSPGGFCFMYGDSSCFFRNNELKTLTKLLTTFCTERQSELEALRVQWGDI